MLKDIVGFPWSECQEIGSIRSKNLTASHCTNITSANMAETPALSMLNAQEIPALNFKSKQDTHGRVYSHRLSYLILYTKCEKEATFFMASQVMRITLKAYDHQLVDASAKKIIETVKKNGSQVSGPVPLPTKKEVVTILRAVHKYKDSREQFEQRTHKRLIDIITPTPKTVDALQRLEMPAGVYIDIKMKNK